MPRTDPIASPPPAHNGHLYEVIAAVLQAHIDTGHLPLGLVLLERPIAELFQTSRAPVQRALCELESRRRIHRFAGRGYLVGGVPGQVSPLRKPLKGFALTIDPQADEALQTRATWERIYASVEAEVASCLVFGCYRIVEAELAAHFSVSRTVARDVLGRLQERGLIRKNQSSHWVAGPLTAKHIRELYEMRAVLEPMALKTAWATLPRSTLQDMRDRCDKPAGSDWTGAAIDRLEDDLHNRLVLATANERLADTLRHLQLPSTQTERFLRGLGLPIDAVLADEHRVVLDLLLQGAADAAGAALAAHLQAESRRSITHLKTVAVIPEPTRLAPYLTRWLG